MDQAHAETFVASWASAWNSHDLERVLAHFADDAVFTSPIAASLVPETHGTLTGKDAIRSYWQLGLDRIPDLHFRVRQVFTGIDCLVVNYENQAGAHVSEVLHFRGDVVVRGHGTYETQNLTTATGIQS